MELVSKKFNIDLDYLKTLINNMSEYMYISINDNIDGFMICLDDSEYINIKNINGNIPQFLRHLIFNANKDITINISIDGLKDFGFRFDGNKYVKKYEKFGFDLYGMMKTITGNETQVFKFDIRKLDKKRTT